MLRPLQSSRFFFSTKARKGKSKKKAPEPEPELPPIPPAAFPLYSSTSSTPLPPPAMPRKSISRRLFPLLVVGTGAYVLVRNSNNEPSVKGKKIWIETSASAVNIETAIAEKAAH